MNDNVVPITNIHLSIYMNVLANQSPTGCSISGNLLWQFNFSQNLFTQILYHEGTAEWWYDPYSGLLLPQADYEIWAYNITIDPALHSPSRGQQYIKDLFNKIV